MYNEEIRRSPKDEDELWIILRQQFDFVREVLWETPLETREDSLNDRYQGVGGLESSRAPMVAIRFRGTSADYDNREYFLNVGRKLLPYVDWAIDTKQFTPEFVQKWGMIMFCHGYIASYFFDDSDDLLHVRAGKKGGQKRSKQAQRKWLARLMVPMIDDGKKRAAAQEDAAAHVKGIVDRGLFPVDFGRDWFASMLSGNELKSTYDDKHFSIKEMRELLDEPGDDIPPTDIP